MVPYTYLYDTYTATYKRSKLDLMNSMQLNILNYIDFHIAIARFRARKRSVFFKNYKVSLIVKLKHKTLSQTTFLTARCLLLQEGLSVCLYWNLPSL